MYRGQHCFEPCAFLLLENRCISSNTPFAIASAPNSTALQKLNGEYRLLGYMKEGQVGRGTQTHPLRSWTTPMSLCYPKSASTDVTNPSSEISPAPAICRTAAMCHILHSGTQERSVIHPHVPWTRPNHDGDRWRQTEPDHVPAPPDTLSITISIRTDRSKGRAAVVSAGPGLPQPTWLPGWGQQGRTRGCLQPELWQNHQPPPPCFGGEAQLDRLRVISTTGKYNRGFFSTFPHSKGWSL